MSNRTLVTYEESRLWDGPYWTLEIQRSAAGRPGILITIREEPYNEALEPREMTISVKDANDIIRPIKRWLEENA